MSKKMTSTSATSQMKDSKPKGNSGRKVRKYPIFITIISFIVLFGFMFSYLVTYVKENETKLINNSYNSMQKILLSRNYRGSIFARDGEVLAETILDRNQEETRSYPYGKLFSHVVGYNSNGKMGIEAFANYYLINTHVSIQTKVNNDVNEMKNPGDNVYTTLDVDLQKIADNYLNVYHGAVVVTEVKTGKILAMVSHPDFDPNEIDRIWDSLLEDKESSILVNRATQGLYPPGSTFKILTSLEYYREFKDKYKTYSYSCNGSYKKDNDKINCYHGTHHGSVNFVKSFAKSCNSSFANIGMLLQKDAFATTLSNVLFDSELPFDYSYSKSHVASLETLDNYAMMQTSIGQGTTTITPLHLNMITCAIANKGILMKPYLVDCVKSAEGSTVKTFKSESCGRLITEEESVFLTMLMKEVVQSGTATVLKNKEYSAAGKTGSAEYNNVKGDSHAWFTGFAPADDPEVAVTIIMEGAGSGGEYAVPLAKRLFDSYFEQSKEAMEALPN